MGSMVIFALGHSPFSSGQLTLFPRLRDKKRVVPRNVRTGRIKGRVIEKKVGGAKNEMGLDVVTLTKQHAKRPCWTEGGADSLSPSLGVFPVHMAKRKFLIEKSE